MSRKANLLDYLTQRHYKHHPASKDPGPVITISREYGCPAKRLAARLSDMLTDKTIVKGEKKPWRWISKEIMYESAKELNLEPKSIKYVFDYEQKSIIDDILSSHSQKYYKSDRKIRSTVADVIRDFAEEGFAIIVGRGGVAITKDIPRSLHVHLEAPLEWRAIRASEKHGISIEEAKRCAVDIDKKRKEFREYFEGKETDYTRFDITLNCMTLSIDEMARIIVCAAASRNLY